MTLAAGAAARDISPPGGVALFGYPHVKRISTGVHDPILASVLYLESGSDSPLKKSLAADLGATAGLSSSVSAGLMLGTAGQASSGTLFQRAASSVVLISLDLLFIDPPTARSIRRAVAEELSIAQAGVFIGCTHTHSAPVTGRLIGWQADPAVPAPEEAYLEFVKEQAVEAVRAAVSKKCPAEIAQTTADATGVGGNRLATDGLTDPEVGLLVIRPSGGGPPLALDMVYGMHPTVLHEDSTLVSSDFPHYARQQLREQFGEDLTVVYHTAPCGNQSPRRFVSGQTFQEAERLGRKLGAAVADSLDALTDRAFTADCPLRASLRKVDLPRRTLPGVAEAERLLAEYEADFQRLQAEGAERVEVRTAECAVFGAEGIVTLARAQQQGQIDRVLAQYEPIEVQLLRIGQTCLAGLPGELFTEYALEIKRLAAPKTFVVSLVNGELQGYIVTPETAGGYEAANSLFTPEAGRVLVDAVLAAL